MITRVELVHDYPFSAREVWKVATDLGHLKTVTEGLLAFRDLPGGEIHQGQVLRVEVSLFGRLPYQPYEMKVAKFDDAKMEFTSEEKGAGVKTWRHSLSVAPTPTGSRLAECIEIDGGFLTPLFAAWARYMYRQRHPRRLHILEMSSSGS
ncbi:SRPBCC family protein [uncultured Roseibium sp.]|uniref:SRPBCC family protein n=1 Tax=uncultured Roseibium sp. TaxID=1936171 RepID=UPI0026134CB9|nr:SRPBCC family protein [uncultured Roseibium sp.]